MTDEKRKIRNARYYENNKERLQKLNMDRYNANIEIILGKKNSDIMRRKKTFKLYHLH